MEAQIHDAPPIVKRLKELTIPDPLGFFDCSTKNLPKYSCCECNYETHLMVKLKNHFREGNMFANITMGPSYKCKSCDFSTFSQLLLTVHRNCNKCARNKDLQLKHPARDKMRWRHCDHCPYKTKDKGNLKRHNICKHLEADKIQWHHCEDCSYKSKQRNNLKRHIEAKHITLQENQELKDLQADKIQWLQCEHCPYKSKIRLKLQKHMMMKHIRSEKCIRCDRCFPTVEDLEEHLKSKHGLGEVEWLQCQDCSYRSKHRTNLKRHVVAKHRVPEEGQLFQCEHCPYKCKMKYNLNRHVRKHFKQKRLVPVWTKDMMGQY